MKKSYYKIYFAKLKKCYKYFPAGAFLKLEYHKKSKKWYVKSNTEFEFYFDTFNNAQLKEYFNKVRYIRTDVYHQL